MPELSPRLLRIVDALPLRPGLRVLEVGGAPGAAAREVAARVGPNGHVLVVDRSRAGIAKTRQSCRAQIAAGIMSTICVSVEELALPADMPRFDIAFGCRVGVLDGRHPSMYERVVRNLSQALVPGGTLFIDTGDPLTAIPLVGT